MPGTESGAGTRLPQRFCGTCRRCRPSMTWSVYARTVYFRARARYPFLTYRNVGTGGVSCDVHVLKNPGHARSTSALALRCTALTQRLQAYHENLRCLPPCEPEEVSSALCFQARCALSAS
eukprot:1364736-Rhodomonas_salina.2